MTCADSSSAGPSAREALSLRQPVQGGGLRHAGAQLGRQLRAEDDVLDQAAISDARIIGADADADADPEPDEAEQLERFRRFLDNASPEDFGPAPSRPDLRGPPFT
jgi:hypothetical protein